MYVHVLPNPPPGTRLADIQQHLRDRGEPSYRFGQLVRAISQGRTSFAEMSNLPRALRSDLSTEFGPAVAALDVIATHHESQVDKVLFGSHTGARIETVLSHYRDGWTSLCLSAQVGCGLGCTFCATGAVGLVRNLSADEICAQVFYFRRQHRIDSLAFMGMGEAVANPHTFAALTLLTDPEFFGISPRRITMSTVGFAPGLARLVREHPQVGVTLSVHSPFDDERARLIPLQHRFPLAANLQILDEHVVATGRKTYLAYLLIDGLNDTDDHLDRLARLVHERSRPHLFHVNVIPYNPAGSAPAEFAAPPAARVRQFVARLRDRGVRTTRRQQFGTMIDAACGQLHARYLDDIESNHEPEDRDGTASRPSRAAGLPPPSPPSDPPHHSPRREPAAVARDLRRGRR